MSYKTVFKREISEIEIKKSRFIGYIGPCSTELEAIEFIKQVKNEHPNARHHCFAYIIGEDNNYQKYSDDGEPSGTAGIPMLELLKKKNLTDVCVVVVRYFGGVLLGAGGLIRAYVGVCNEVTNKAIIVEKKEYNDIILIIDYNNYGKILNFLEEDNYYIHDKIFEDSINLNLYIEKAKMEELEKELLNITNGNITIQILKTLLLNSKNGELIIEDENEL